MNDQEYLSELRQRLAFHGASRRRANEIVAEVRSHLADSGEDPVDAFGTPEQYAGSVLRGYRWPTARVLALSLLVIVGGSLTLRSLRGWLSGDDFMSVRTDQFIDLVALALLAQVFVLPVMNRRFPRSAMRTVLVLLIVGVTTSAVSFLAPSLFGERPLVSPSPLAGLLMGLGLLAGAAVVALVWRRVRRPSPPWSAETRPARRGASPRAG